VLLGVAGLNVPLNEIVTGLAANADVNNTKTDRDFIMILRDYASGIRF